MKRIIIMTVVVVSIPFFVVSFWKEESEKSLGGISLKYLNGVVVRVKRSDGKIEKVPLEEYVVGVVSGEMPASFEVEALKAQSVASRTYVLKKVIDNKNNDYDKLNNDNLKKDFIDLAIKYGVVKFMPKRRIDLANLIFNNALDKIPVLDKEDTISKMINFVINREIKIKGEFVRELKNVSRDNPDAIAEMDANCKTVLWDIIKESGDRFGSNELPDGDYDENKFTEFLNKQPVWQHALTIIKYRVFCNKTGYVNGGFCVGRSSGRKAS